jgi:hypothetical protein
MKTGRIASGGKMVEFFFATGKTLFDLPNQGIS